MTRRIIRTIDGQVFSDSRGRFQDRRGEILYKRGLFNTVRINRRSISSDDVSGSPAALLLAVLVIIFVVILLAALSVMSHDLADDEIQRNPNVTAIALTKAMAATKPKATAEAKSEVIVDAKSGKYYFSGCSQLEQVERHDRRIFSEQQAKSFGYKLHEACSR